MGRSSGTLKRIIYENGLSLSAGGLFLLFLILQGLAGHGAYNAEQVLHGNPVVSFGEYLKLPHFWSALFENWESEFLQMGLLVVLSEKLRQKGSAQSRKMHDQQVEEELRTNEIEAQARENGETPGPVKSGGWKLKLYSNSLLLAFSALFVVSFFGHIMASFIKERAEDGAHNGPVPTLLQYLSSSSFWFESMQNWQSEFLAMLSVIVLSIWLRAKNSTESKPVGAAHSYTGH